ncbi:MAG: hypothetical protein WD690_12160 [Vicinamibacterales bacterium]
MKLPAHWAVAGHETLAAIGALSVAPDRVSPSILDPATGLTLSISGVDAGAATCPSCETRSANAAFVAVVEDLRLLFGCPSCQRLTWLSGA